MYRYIITSFFVIFLFSGCVGTTQNLEYSKREYPGVSKDAILNAAKRVIKLSDEDFTISSKRHSVAAIRAIPKNKGFTVDININELELNATTTDDITTAYLVIKKKNDIFSDTQLILTGSIHDLFWDRVEYLLGLKRNWYTCTQYRLLGNFDGFFCDIKYNSNIYPSQSDILKEITIQKPILVVEETLNPTQIDLSSLEGIELPFKVKPIETPITLAELNTSGLFNLDSNSTSINEINTTIDTNISTTETIEAPIESNISLLLEDKEITPLDPNATIISDITEILIEDNNDTNRTNLDEIVNSVPLEQPLITEEPIVEPIVEAKPEENLQNTTTKTLSSFGERFMQSDPKNYTINLATLYTKEQTDQFLNEYNLKENTFAIGFINEPDNKYYIKLMHGIFESKNEAKNALDQLPDILKAGQPLIETLQKKQDLFNKKGEDLNGNAK